MMTIDECIAECERIALVAEPLKQAEAYQYNRQLAEWLMELKAFHDAMDIIPTTPFDVDLGEIPINNRSYDDIVKCLMIAYERGKKDTLSLIEQYILGGKR